MNALLNNAGKVMLPDEHAEKVILVTGATGKQGGAVARHLLASGWRVHALCRNPRKPAAQALADMGAVLEQGDLNDEASLRCAMQGVYGVFAMQPMSWPYSHKKEVQQGMHLASAAKAANVEHYVFSSVGGADRRSGVPHIESKWLVEQYIRELQLPATILRPVSFMDALFNITPLRRSIYEGKLLLPFKHDKPWQMIALDDFAAFVVMAFENRQDFLGKAIELAGDEITLPQAAEILGRVIGKDVRFVSGFPLPMFLVRLISSPTATMFTWLNKKGFAADIPSLRAMYPKVMTLEMWLRKMGWDKAGA